MAKKEGAADDAPAGAAPQVIEKIIEREVIVEKVVKTPVREKLPRNRTSRTFEFRVADCKGFVTVGEYADGRPGEVFLKVAKQGSTLAGVMDSLSISLSYALQYGVPLRTLVEAFANTRFEPAGMTDDPELRIASSLLDYIFRRLAVDYLTLEERQEIGILTVSERIQPTLPGVEETVVENRQGTDMAADPKSIPSVSELEIALAEEAAGAAPSQPSLLDRAGVTDLGLEPVAPPQMKPSVQHSDAPYCMQCGVQMQRAGSCHACPSCGSTSGCS